MSKLNQTLKEIEKKKKHNAKIVIRIKKIVFELQSYIGISKDDDNIKIISNRQKKMKALLSKIEEEFKKLKK